MHFARNTTILIFILSLSHALYSAPKYPFPQKATYKYGILPTTINHEKVQQAYDDFIARFYQESGDKARIKFDEPDNTVSEGIGYGMLIMVYMDNATNNTQGKFDKLWKYYNSFLNDNQLMHWKISGFSHVINHNAATDAEVDVAAALIQAYKQWGDDKYLNDARALVGKIYQHEVNGNGYLKPGDAWDDEKNPSYFSTAAMESFKNVGSQDWNRVITNSYNLLKQVRNSNTGLVPDWCSEWGSPSGGDRGHYKYDAARTPWRIAWDYVWHGRTDAKDICTKMASWIKTKTGGIASQVVDGYTLNGDPLGEWDNTTFVGPLGCAGMVDASHQAWLDNANTRMNTFAGRKETYYNSSLKVITMLLLSGNMPDFWNYTPAKPKFTLTTVSTPSNGGTVQVPTSAAQYDSGTTVTLSAQPSNGYRFLYWSGDATGTETSKTITMTKNMNITANFELYNATGSKRILPHTLSLFADKNTITWAIPRAGNVCIRIVDMVGRKIAQPVNAYITSGISSIKLSTPLKKGMYLVQMQSSSGKLTQQLFVER